MDGRLSTMMLLLPMSACLTPPATGSPDASPADLDGAVAGDDRGGGSCVTVFRDEFTGVEAGANWQKQGFANFVGGQAILQADNDEVSVTHNEQLSLAGLVVTVDLDFFQAEPGESGDAEAAIELVYDAGSYRVYVEDGMVSTDLDRATPQVVCERCRAIPAGTPVAVQFDATSPEVIVSIRLADAWYQLSDNGTERLDESVSVRLRAYGTDDGLGQLAANSVLAETCAE